MTESLSLKCSKCLEKTTIAAKTIQDCWWEFSCDGWDTNKLLCPICASLVEAEAMDIQRYHEVVELLVGE